MSRSPTERLLLTSQGLLDATGRAWPDLAAWCQAHPRRRVALYVTPQRQHSLLLPADLPLPDPAARERYARIQLSHYFGSAALGWPVATSADAACALTHDDPAALQATAAAQGGRLVALQPSWALAPAGDGSHQLLDGPLLTELRRDGGRLVDLQARHVDDDLLASLPATGRLHTPDLLAAGPVAGAPDFIAPASRLRPLAWAWAGAAALCCGLVALQGLGQREEAQALAEQAAVLDRLARASAPAAQPPLSPAARSRAGLAARQLAVDWAARWGDVDGALPPGLALASLDLDAQVLRLEGQTASADTVTQLVDRLALQAGPGEEVVLTRLQQPGTASGAGELKFELVRRAAGALP